MSRFIAAWLELFQEFHTVICYWFIATGHLLYYFCVTFPKDRANEIYKKVEDLKSIRGRNQDAILAACLYIACRQEDRPRTVKGK